MVMNIAYSPCPNDTFVFHALVHGLIPNTPSFDVTYADIDVTNKLASRLEGPDIMKISFAALPYVLENYALLPCGGALGRGCGPLVLTKEKTDQVEYLRGRTIAVPSDRSTAYMLLRLWTSQQLGNRDAYKVIVMPFHEIMPAVEHGHVDAGLVIHEARFTYPTYGLSMLCDLGQWWEEDTGLPIPLGAIIARRGKVDTDALTKWIQASVQYAWDHPDESRDYVMQHAQEMSSEVAQFHIDLYVNNYTYKLGKEGYQAIESLLLRAAEEGIVPKINLKQLKQL